MAKGKILVFGGTGPAGICLLRELLFREHETIAFARNPAKIPEDLASNPLLEVSLYLFTLFRLDALDPISRTCPIPPTSPPPRDRFNE